MTVTTTINALTNSSFSSTLVTAALAAAETMVTSYIDEIYSAGSDDKLDLAVALASKEILEQGRNSAKRKTSKDKYDQTVILTDEIIGILDEYKISTVPVPVLIDTSPSDHWRS